MDVLSPSQASDAPRYVDNRIPAGKRMEFLMTDRPIIFSAPMVRALLSGSKTQTRRIIKPQPDEDGLAREIAGGWFDTSGRKYPLAEPGDRLYVRENFCLSLPCGTPVYHATLGQKLLAECSDIKWKPSIHMPRTLSRLTLEVTGVKVERLQDISEEDAKAEGVEAGDYDDNEWLRSHPYGAEFWNLWDSLNAKRDGGIYAWAANPWVVAPQFAVHHANIDSMKEAA